MYWIQLSWFWTIQRLSTLSLRVNSEFPHFGKRQSYVEGWRDTLETGMQSWLGSWMVLLWGWREMINRQRPQPQSLGQRLWCWPSSLLYPQTRHFLCSVFADSSLLGPSTFWAWLFKFTSFFELTNTFSVKCLCSLTEAYLAYVPWFKRPHWYRYGTWEWV